MLSSRFLNRTARLTLAPAAFAGLCLIAPCSGAFAGASAAQDRPDVPAPRYQKDGSVSQAFLTAHASYVARDQKSPIGIMFMGDSITARWVSVGATVFRQSFPSDTTVDFGFGGDKTQNMLWRIENGEIDDFKPALVVLMAGTNNLRYGDTPDATVEGVKKLVGTIRERSPNTKVLILGILPEGYDPTDPQVEAIRSVIARTNAKLAHLDNGSTIRFIDFGADYIDPDGTISPDLLSGGIHPTVAGYQIWANAMQPMIVHMLGRVLAHT